MKDVKVEEVEEKNKQLIFIDPATASDVFASHDAMDLILSKVESEVANFVGDLSTEKGRKEIKSMAYSVSRSKTYLDDMGAALVADIKSKVKEVDLVRRDARLRLDELRDKVKAPLVEWQKKEDEIRDSIYQKVLNIRAHSGWTMENPLESLKGHLQTVIEIEVDSSFGGLEVEAQMAKDEAHTHLTKLIEHVTLKEKNEKELTMLRKEKEEREAAEAIRIAKEKEEEAKKVEAERIKKEEEEREKLVQQRIKKKKEEAEKKAEEAEAARIKAEKDKIEAAKKSEEARIKVEKEKIEVAKEAEEARIKAELKAEEDKKSATALAVENERLRVEAEKQAEVEASLKRTANIENIRRVHKLISLDIWDIMEGEVDEETIEKLINSIDDGEIRHLTINY